MKRALLVLSSAVLVLALTASSAFAQASGAGPIESTDKNVTMFAFGVIGFFPLFILCMSLIQWQLEKRKERRKAQTKARQTSEVWAGGW